MKFARTAIFLPYIHVPVFVALGIILSSCGQPAQVQGGLPPDEHLTVAVLSSDLAVGPNRLVLAVRDRNGQPVAGGPLALRLTPLIDAAAPPVEAQAMPRPAGVAGMALYAAAVALPAAGEWRVGVQAPSGVPETPWRGSAFFEVHAAPATPALGTPAPRTAAPSLRGNTSLAALTALPDPDPALYEHDPAAIIGAGRPVVLTLAAPALCPVGECAAEVAVLRHLLDQFGERIIVRHIDPFPSGQAAVSDIVKAWNLKTQPWTFVLDGTGRIVAKFEGFVGAEEVGEALERALIAGM